MYLIKFGHVFGSVSVICLVTVNVIGLVTFNEQVRMNELEGSRMFVNLSRHSTRSSVARQRTTRSSVAGQVWNGLRIDDAPGTNLSAGTNLV